MSACESRYYCVYIIFYWDGCIMSACESRYYCVYIIFYWDGGIMSACESRYYCVYIIFYWDGGIMSACESRYYCVYIIFYWDGCIMSACETPVDNFKKTQFDTNTISFRYVDLCGCPFKNKFKSGFVLRLSVLITILLLR